jgi:hypothetical protein
LTVRRTGGHGRGGLSSKFIPMQQSTLLTTGDDDFSSRSTIPAKYVPCDSETRITRKMTDKGEVLIMILLYLLACDDASEFIFVL